jgi:hypothetical protein
MAPSVFHLRRTFMLPDTRIIQRHGLHTVLAERLCITWPGGSSVGLHPVRLRGRDERFLRALQYDRLLWLVVDVRDLAATLATEIPALPWRDTDGLMLHTLRLKYPSADALRARAVTRFKAGWAAMPGVAPTVLPMPEGHCWRRSGASAMGALA